MKNTLFILTILLVMVVMGCKEGGGAAGASATNPSPTPTPAPVGDVEAPSLTADDVSGNEGSLITINLVGSDPQGLPLTYSCVSGCPSGYAISSNSATWTPGYSDAGIHDITFKVTNGTLEATGTLRVTVNNTNRAPVFNALSGATINENQPITISPSAVDPDGDAVTITLISALPANANFSSQQVSFTPSYAQSGSYNFIFRASDGILTADTSMTVSVSNVNRSPIMSIGAKSGSENTAISFSVGASDPDGDGVSYSASNLPSGASLNSSSGAFSWTPSCTQEGSYNVTINATDGGLTATEIVPFTIAHTNCYTPAWLGSAFYGIYSESKASLVEIIRYTALDNDAPGNDGRDGIHYGYAGIQIKCFAGSTPFTVSYDDTNERITFNNVSLSDESHTFLVYAQDNDGVRIYKWIRLRWLNVSPGYYSVASTDQGTTYTQPSSAWLCPSGSPIVVNQ